MPDKLIIEGDIGTFEAAVHFGEEIIIGILSNKQYHPIGISPERAMEIAHWMIDAVAEVRRHA